MKIDNTIQLIYVDLFCGAGGTTTGIVQATKEGKQLAKVIACVNHDPNAIKSHWENHPEVVHFEEDIRTLDLTPLIALCKEARLLYPNAKLVLWASLECTNFSKAKGGQSREADSRTLAEHLPRYITAINPDYVQIENVVEFMSWGPLDENGKPISMQRGEDWLRWREGIKAMGYIDDWKQLNSANYGAYTSRNRLFGCFYRPHLPIAFPEPTHTKQPQGGALFQELKQWKPVKEVLDFSDEGNSIFNRKIPIVPKSLERIYAGLVKFVAGGKENFLLKYNSTNQKGVHIPPSVDEPCPTVATQNRLGLVQASFICKHFSGRPEGKVVGVNGPTGALTTACHQSITNVSFMASYYGNGHNIRSVDEPAPTLLTADNQSLIQTEWIERPFSKATYSSIDYPAGAITSVPKLTKVKVSPIDTKYILNPSHGGHTTSIEKPSPVIVARQDKAPLYLISCIVGNVSIPVYEGEPEIMVKIKEFMAMYGIADIKMRMLKVKELLLIQGFPKEYVLIGNQSEQKKFIGNSVVPHVVKCWVESLCFELDKLDIAA